MRGLWCAFVGAIVACGALPAVAAAQVTNVTPPTIAGVPTVGAHLICGHGSWTDSNNSRLFFTYGWFVSTDLADAVGSGERFVPTASQVNQRLVCEVTARDRFGATGSANSAPSAPVLPRANVLVTHYSPTATGSIGEPLAGVTVTLSLLRGPVGSTIGTGTATTDSTGAWTARLAPANPSSGPVHGVAAGDTLTTHYAPPAGDPSAAVPVDTTFTAQFIGATTSISQDGTKVVSSQPCQQVRFRINGTTETPGSGPSGCQFSPASGLTDADNVQVQFAFSRGFAATLRTRDQVGLLDVLGAPTCSADLVTDVVTCNALDAGTFAVSRNGGAGVTLTKTGTGPFTGTARVPGVKAGDTITLDETSPTATTRHLATLHLRRLHVSLTSGPEQTLTTGACQPGLEIAPGGLCPPSGAIPGPLSFTSVEQQSDDRGGGFETVTPPSLANFIPNDGASIFGGTFTAYADLAGGGTPSELRAETASVRLKVRPHGGSTLIFNKVMTDHLDSDSAFETADLTGLTPARYFATWVLTDVAGDTNTYTTEFAVQPTGAELPK